MSVELYTYRDQDISALDALSDEERERLRSRIDLVTDALSESLRLQQDKEPGEESVLEIEEDAPEFNGDVFNPGGWVGQLTPEVSIVPYTDGQGVQKLTTEQYLDLASQIQDWAELLGADTISATLPLNPDVALDRYSQIAPISEALIEQTSAVLAERLPVRVERADERSREPQGRILSQQTMQQAARQTGEVVSRKVLFTPDSPENRLLVRFHTQLAALMEELSDEHAYYEQLFGDQLTYHRELLSQEPFVRLREAALETDFSDPETLQQLRTRADARFELIVDLWEAFLEQVNLELAAVSSFTTALKPLSKTYELWCLRLLVEALEELTDSTPRQEIRGTYRFADQITLHYNQRAGSAANTDSGLVSQYFKPILGTTSGDPDFAVSQDDQVVWVGDAKFMTEVGLDEYRQLLSYAVDLLPPEGGYPGTLLYCHPSDSEIGGDVQEYEITAKTVHPNHQVSSSGALNAQLQNALDRV